MVVPGVLTCPICGGELKYYDSVKRVVRSKWGKAYLERRKAKNSNNVDDDELWNILPEKSDYKRWARVSQKGEEYYTNLAEKLRNRNVSEVSKKEMKAVEKWVKTGFFTNAEFADTYFRGKTTNYLNDTYSSDNNPFVKQKKSAWQKYKDDWKQTIETGKENAAKMKAAKVSDVVGEPLEVKPPKDAISENWEEENRRLLEKIKNDPSIKR